MHRAASRPSLCQSGQLDHGDEVPGGRAEDRGDHLIGVDDRAAGDLGDRLVGAGLDVAQQRRRPRALGGGKIAEPLGQRGDRLLQFGGGGWRPSLRRVAARIRLSTALASRSTRPVRVTSASTAPAQAKAARGHAHVDPRRRAGPRQRRQLPVDGVAGGQRPLVGHVAPGAQDLDHLAELGRQRAQDVGLGVGEQCQRLAGNRPTPITSATAPPTRTSIARSAPVPCWCTATTSTAEAAAWLGNIIPSPKKPKPTAMVTIIVTSTITPSAAVLTPSSGVSTSAMPMPEQHAGDHLGDSPAALDVAGAQRDRRRDRGEERLGVAEHAMSDQPRQGSRHGGLQYRRERVQHPPAGAPPGARHVDPGAQRLGARPPQAGSGIAEPSPRRRSARRARRRLRAGAPAATCGRSARARPGRRARAAPRRSGARARAGSAGRGRRR